MQTWRRGFATFRRRLHQRPVAGQYYYSTQTRCAELLNLSREEASQTVENKNVTIKGFVRSVRKQKRFAFAEISDGSTVKSLQAILTPKQAAE